MIIFGQVNFKLPYGLRDDALVTINEVEGGLACKCICPTCHEKLIAKKGAAMPHHFSHYRRTACKGGLETALHKICKDIIFDKKAFTTPPYFSSRGKTLAAATTIRIENVYLEKKLGGIVPDIVIECQGKNLLIEIEVTHPVDEKKLKKIRREGYAVILIDAKRMIREMFEKKDYLLKSEAFQEALVYGTACKKWLHNPKYKNIEKAQAKERARSREQDFLQHNYITVPKGRVKEFKSFKKKSGFEFFYVEDCPIALRTWQSGTRAGRPYAASDDCKACIFCHKLELRPYPRTTFMKYLFPNRVDCTGHFDLLFDKTKYQITGKGPREYFQKTGRFLVVYGQEEKLFFYRFYKAYNHYLKCGSASIFNAKTGELIEQKIQKEKAG